MKCSSHIEELTPAQREIIDETFFDGRTRAPIVKHRGISESTYDNHLQGADGALRKRMMEVVETSTDVDRPCWYDLVGISNGRHAARQLRRTSCKKDKRFTSQHERSSFTGEPFTVAPERPRIAREGAALAVSAATLRANDAKLGWNPAPRQAKRPKLKTNGARSECNAVPHETNATKHNANVVRMAVALPRWQANAALHKANAPFQQAKATCHNTNAARYDPKATRYNTNGIQHEQSRVTCGGGAAEAARDGP